MNNACESYSLSQRLVNAHDLVSLRSVDKPESEPKVDCVEMLQGRIHPPVADCDALQVDTNAGPVAMKQ